MNTKMDNSIKIIKSEFFRYESSVKRLNFMLNKSNKEIERLEQQLKETQEKLKIAVDALEFYAPDKYGFVAVGRISNDLGKTARQALEKIGEK